MPTLKKSPKQHNRRINRESRNKIYQSVFWKKIRQAKLLQQPLCELCLKKGVITPAVDVHHDISFINNSGMIDFSLAYDFSNLISLCKECHSKIHSQYGKTNGEVKNILTQK